MTTNSCTGLLLISLFACSGHASAQSSRWSLGTLAAFSDFRGGARDLSGVPLEPSSRIEYGLVGARDTGPWHLELALTWAPGHLSTRDSTGRIIQLEILTESFPRIRIAPALGRRIVGLGAGGIGLEAGPVLDLWSGDDQVRPRAGGQLRVVLASSLGRLALRNYLAWSITASPFTASEFGPSIRRPAVEAISAGVTLDLGL